MRISLSRVVLMVSLAVAVGPTSAQAKDKWINLTTKNFNIVSNADEGGTRKLGLKLEQFHFVFSRIFNLPLQRPVPTTVIVFKNDGSFKPFKPLYNGKPANLAGYFQKGEDENVIALDIGANAQRPMSVIYHEYTHLLTSYTPKRWPVWMMEGLAELYSSFEVIDNQVTLGSPIENHILLLRQKTFLPLPELLHVVHGSPAYNERDKQGIFYAESWALCHYLMFGDANARQPQMAQFASLINQSVDEDKAFSQAFKATPAEIEKQLRNYIQRNTYTINNYKLPTTEGEKNLNLRPISDGEAQAYLGNLLARTQRLDEAEALLKEAISAEPDVARAYEGLGFVAMRRGQYDQALDRFKEAVTRGSKNYLAHYYYAEMLQRSIRGKPDPAIMQLAAEELRSSIKLMPGFAHAYYSLGTLALMTGQNLKEGVEALKTAVRLEPQSKHFLLSLAQLQARMQDYAAAKKTLEPLIADDSDPRLKSSAESTLRLIEEYTRPQREVAVTAEPVDPTEADKQEKASSASRQPPPQVSGRPSIKREGTQTVRGVLVSIDCKGGTWTLVVNTKDDLLRFIVSNKDKLEFFSQDPDVDGQVKCGPINRIAFIYFKPVAGQKNVAGDAVAVEFTR